MKLSPAQRYVVGRLYDGGARTARRLQQLIPCRLTYSTMHALDRRGLIRRVAEGSDLWDRTDAGRRLVRELRWTKGRVIGEIL